MQRFFFFFFFSNKFQSENNQLSQVLHSKSKLFDSSFMNKRKTDCYLQSHSSTHDKSNWRLVKDKKQS